MNGNGSFFILAVGHYGADAIEVHLRLRSERPDKQLLELDALLGAITTEAEALRARLLDAAPRIMPPGSVRL